MIAANMARALEVAKTALRLAPRDEWAHLVMAWAWAYAADGRLEEAIAECERGLEINPNAPLIMPTAVSTSRRSDDRRRRSMHAGWP